MPRAPPPSPGRDPPAPRLSQRRSGWRKGACRQSRKPRSRGSRRRPARRHERSARQSAYGENSLPAWRSRLSMHSPVPPHDEEPPPWPRGVPRRSAGGRCMPPLHDDDDLADFTVREVTLEGLTKRVHVAGAGPAVIVMAEMPGISPHLARFARWVRDAGFTVYLPSLFGRDGAVPGAGEGAEIFRRACVSAEFRAFAASQSSPVTSWLLALAQLAHRECGGPGAGAIGMCFTGNFALTMMLEPSMLAPVLAEPALPLEDPGGLEISPEDLATVRARMERENLNVHAYRFEGDHFCRAERFA